MLDPVYVLIVVVVPSLTVLVVVQTDPDVKVRIPVWGEGVRGQDCLVGDLHL